MTKPLLSILIASIPSRIGQAITLYESLLGQASGTIWGRVEILMLLDNKQRTVGAKRQALLDISSGEYVTFVDDDDSVSDQYVSKITTAIGDGRITRWAPRPDVVVWPIRVTINGEQDGLVYPSMDYVKDPIPEYSPPITKRPPHHLCCWRRSIAIKGTFPDKQHGEDFEWARQVWPYVGTEMTISDTLYHYRWDKTVTEAEPV